MIQRTSFPMALVHLVDLGPGAYIGGLYVTARTSVPLCQAKMCQMYKSRIQNMYSYDPDCGALDQSPDSKPAVSSQSTLHFGSYRVRSTRLRGLVAS